MELQDVNTTIMKTVFAWMVVLKDIILTVVYMLVVTIV
jgi:hypothetical protein